MDVEQSEQYTDASARQAVWMVFGGLFAFGIGLFAFAVSADIYFNATAIDTLLVICGLCGIALVRSVIVMRTQSMAGQRGGDPRWILLSLSVPVISFLVLALLAFATCRDSITFYTPIYRGAPNRGCSRYDYFDNPPLRQVSSVCQDKLPRAVWSGGRVKIVEDVGPLGVRLKSIDLPSQ